MKKISVAVPPEDYAAFQALCAARGTTISDWVRETLKEAAGMTDKLAKSPPDLKVLKGGSPPPPVVYAPHSCYYLRGVLPPNMTARECQGTCGHPTHVNMLKPCYWPTSAAQSCPMFVGRRAS